METEFLRAVHDYQKIIYKICRVYRDRREDQEDLFQEIVYQLWKSFETFNEKSKLSTWIYRVSLNVAIYQLKKSKKRVITVPIDESAFKYHADEEIDDEEKWTFFRQQIERLNLLDKGIVMLYLEDKSYEEIAEIIGMSTSNVGTRLNRIKDKLKQQTNKK